MQDPIKHLHPIDLLVMLIMGGVVAWAWIQMIRQWAGCD